MKLSILAYIIKKVQQGLGIVQDTDTATRAISSGKYVFWKNKFKKASTNIAENDTLSMSNLVDVNDGALNEIADHIVTLEAVEIVTCGVVYINAYTSESISKSIAKSGYTPIMVSLASTQYGNVCLVASTISSNHTLDVTLYNGNNALVAANPKFYVLYKKT